MDPSRATLKAFIVALDPPKPGARFAVQVCLEGEQHKHRLPGTLATFDTREDADANIHRLAEAFTREFNDEFNRRIEKTAREQQQWTNPFHQFYHTYTYPNGYANSNTSGTTRTTTL